jgi:formylmethanofuran dehydrogenase subunit D
MKLKRLMAVLLTTLLLLGGLFSNVSLAATPGSLKVFYSNNGASANSNQIYVNIKLRNAWTSDIDLSKLTIRYYFTKDNTKELKYYTDYVSIGSVSTAFYDYSPTASKADKYIEIKPSSGTISPAGAQWPKQSEVTIQGRVAKSDWSNFDQSNDFSYTGATSQYVENSYIAVFESGTLIAGSVPNGGSVSNPPSPTATRSPTPTKASATPTKFVPTPTKSVPTPTKAPATPTKASAIPTKPTASPSKGEIFVTLDKTTAALGDIIKATLSVKDFDVVAGYQANIKYDPAVLQPVYLDGTPYDNSSSPDYGTLLQKRYSGTDMASNDLPKGILTFGRTYMSLDSYKASGVKENTGSLAIIGFKVLKTTSTRITLEDTSSLTNPVSGTMVFDWNGAQLSGYTVTQAPAINSGNVPSATPTKAATPTLAPTPTPTKVVTSPSTGEVYLTLDKTTAAVSDIIQATLSVKGFDVVAGYQANIKYDPTVLQPVYLDGTPYDNSSAPDYGTLLQKRYSGTDLSSNDITKGTLTFGRTYMNMSGYKNSGIPENTGSLAVIGFKVLKDVSTRILLENASSLTNPVMGTMVFDWDGIQLSGYTVTQAPAINSSTVPSATPTKAATPTLAPTPTPTKPVTSPTKGEVCLTVDKTTAAVGNIIEATLSVKGFDVVAGYQANIKYDPAVLQPVYLDGTPYDSTSAPDYGTLLQKRYSGTDMAMNDLTKGTLTFGRTYMNMASYKNSGVAENTGSLAIIGFKVLKVAPTKITLENSSSLTNPVIGTMVFDWDGIQLSNYAVTQAPGIN